MDIRTRLITFHTSKNGSVKFKTIPTELYDDIISATSDYESYHDGHVKIRAWMLVNNHDVPHCENCNSPFYPTRTDQFGVKRFCSFQCSNGNASSREKSKQTCMEKYGVDNPTKSSRIIEKAKQTCLERYGTPSFSQTDEFKEKFKSTMNDRYGADYAMQSDELKKRHHNSMEHKYGFNHALQHPIFSDKFKSTMNDRYGADYAMQSDELKKRHCVSIFNNHGVRYPTQKNFPIETIDVLLNKVKFSSFMINKTPIQAATILKVDSTTVHKYIKEYNITEYISNRSTLEVDMSNFLDILGADFIVNTRKVISNELDFYIPSSSIAIEMNGDYWHSEERGKDRVYHYNKWKECIDKGIRLIQITETDWINNTECVRNLIRSSLGLKVKGDPARKCTVREISAKEARPFVDHYHLQGFATGTSYLGAYDTSGELCGVMIFGWTRGSKSARRFELKRWVMDNKSHAGLFSKVFKYSQRQLEFNEVVSFSMNDWFTGDVYEKAGFVYDGMLDPDYRYHYSRRLVHKSNFRKSEICKKFPELSEEIKNGMTEKEAMESLGIPRVWDSGKKIWLWKKHQDDE